MKTGLLLILFSFNLICFGQFVPHAYNYDIDNFPSVYGGKTEWKRFMHDHLVYPDDALKDKLEGTVKIYFIVTKEGRAARARVTESVCPSIDYEALRLLSMLEWWPAYQKEEAVNMEWDVTVKFSISKYKKWVKERGYSNLKNSDLPIDSSFIIFETFDTAPEFVIPGKTFPEFISSNIDYPQEARLQGLEGKIILSFIIEPDGYVSNIRIKEGVVLCNAEMIRVIGLTKWKPAIKNGKYIRYRMYHTTLFNLKNSFKDNASGSQRLGGQ